MTFTVERNLYGIKMNQHVKGHFVQTRGDNPSTALQRGSMGIMRPEWPNSERPKSEAQSAERGGILGKGDVPLPTSYGVWSCELTSKPEFTIRQRTLAISNVL